MSRNFCSLVCSDSAGHSMWSARVITELNGMSESCSSRVDLTVWYERYSKLLNVSPSSHLQQSKHFHSSGSHLLVTHTVLILTFIDNMGRDSADIIGIRCVLDGPEIELQGRQNFLRPCRPKMGPTQPFVRWVWGLFPWHNWFAIEFKTLWSRCT